VSEGRSWVTGAVGEARARPFVAVAMAASIVFIPLTVAKLSLGRGKALFVSDGYYYYAYLASIVVDRDLDLGNQYAHIGSAASNGWGRPIAATGRRANPFSIGPALLWLPAFAAVHIAVRVANSLGCELPHTGFELYYQVPTYTWGFLLGLAGFLLLARCLVRMFPQHVAVWTLTGILFGTALSNYAFLHCNFAHWMSCAAVSLLLWTAFESRARALREYWWIGVGACFGLACLLRWQSALLAPLLLVACPRETSGRWSRRVAGLLGALAVAAVVFLPQVAAWRAVYGHWLVVPQGQGFLRWGQPSILHVLWSRDHGLFTYSPLLLLAVVGFLGCGESPHTPRPTPHAPRPTPHASPPLAGARKCCGVEP